MRYQSNPLSNARREHLHPLIVKAIAGKYKSIPAPPGLKLLDKVKIGPFKLAHWTDQEGRHYFSGYRHFIYGGPDQNQAGQHWPIGSMRWDHYFRSSLNTSPETAWATYQNDCNARLSMINDEASSLLDNVAEADPTASGEYATWISRQSLAGNLHIYGATQQGHLQDEDVEKVYQDLSAFEGRKRRGAIPVEYRDINRFATYGDFFEALQRFGGVVTDREALQTALSQSQSVYKSDRYEVIEIRSWQLAKKLATGTAWCVRGTSMAQHYLKDQENYPLYLFMRNDERFALLTNLPGSEQFMNIKDEPITEKEIKSDPELLELVAQFSTWIYCADCEHFYWGETEGDLSSAINSITYERRSEMSSIDHIAPYLGSSWLIAKIPSLALNEPIVGKSELFEDKIVIGPGSSILRIEGADLPEIPDFTKKAGFTESECIRSILECSVCDTCHTLRGKVNLPDVLQALFVLKPCEDYPCCGHEPLSMGAPGCPPTNEDGVQVGMRCICGAFVPLGSRTSLCKKCMAAAICEDSNDYDYDYDYEESDESDDDYADYDGCPVEDLSSIINSALRRWAKIPSGPWNLARDGRGQLNRGPHWSEFERPYELLDQHSQHLNSDAKALFQANQRNLQKIWHQGWFDQATFQHLIKFYEDLVAMLASDCQQCPTSP